MLCPFCNVDDDKVIDSRATTGGQTIRRRRHCLACGRRFTTYERIEDRVRLAVIKRDGTRMPYDRARIHASIRQAAYKRPVSSERIEQATDEVEEALIAAFDKEVSSHAIGERVAAVLRRVDPVAFVRFASVYRRFEDAGDFIEEAQELLEGRDVDIPGQGSLFDENDHGNRSSEA